MKKNILITIVFLTLLNVSNLWAKRNVRIATISVMPPIIDLHTKPQKVVDMMINFWQNELNNVLPDKPDLIVLPEACDRPQNFYLDWNIETTFYKVRGNQILDFFAKTAKENHCYIAYSTKHQVADGSYRNSTFMIDREGKVIGTYNKNFPTIGEMKRGVKAGKDAPVFKCDFGTVGALICFDLLFDELMEKYATKKPDVLIFPARYHGGMMQSIWAYNTQSYFVGSIEDRPGLPSQIYNPVGELVATTTNYTNYVVADVNLDYEVVHIDYNWDKLKKLKEKYGKEVTIHDPGYVGVVLVSSESDSVSVQQMLKEFDIKNWDDYYKRSVAYRNKHAR